MNSVQFPSILFFMQCGAHAVLRMQNTTLFHEKSCFYSDHGYFFTKEYKFLKKIKLSKMYNVVTLLAKKKPWSEWKPAFCVKKCCILHSEHRMSTTLHKNKIDANWTSYWYNLLSQVMSRPIHSKQSKTTQKN